MDVSEWNDPGRRSLGMYVSDASEAFFMFIHGGDWEASLTLPSQPWGTTFALVAHTGRPGEFASIEAAPLLAGGVMTVPGKTVLVFEACLSDARPHSATVAVAS